ncbi:MAG TPA: hypothetical protein VNV41_04375 [Candidatus Acidoferrales bacterium]|jgi:hypothetical protein|nr:hypothetical protein [Candidatus Acidoferrales bacterium]
MLVQKVISVPSLESYLDSLRFWLILWTVIVAIGLVVEYATDIAKFVTHMFRWVFLHHPPTEKIFNKTLIGGLLITVGVLGEAWIEFRASRAETHLRNANDAMVSQLNSEAARARKDAAGAIERASNAEADLAASNERAAQADARAAEAEKATEEEKVARLKIQAEIAPRRVTGNQTKQLVAFLHPTGSQGVAVISMLGSPEADDFAEDIGRALYACGFGVGVTKGVWITPIPRPFRVVYGSDRKDDAENINQALVKVGIASKLIVLEWAQKEPDALRLFVGPKP